MNYDVLVVGAGHAGCEAALATARLNLNTLLITMNIDSVALLACNPSIGGTGKGHLVREIDALGGEMAHVIDDVILQCRMLNKSKGPAVHSLRAQADKNAYHGRMLKALFSQDNLDLLQAEAEEIIVENGKAKGIKITSGECIYAPCVIIATGVYLNSRIIIGEHSEYIGPQGFASSKHFSKSLLDCGFSLRRFKTGTPARVDYRSIDFSKMQAQHGDEPIVPFSFLTDRRLINTHCCYLTWTNEKTHDIIRKNLHLSPMFSGDIKGTGARYCPSIEDKIYRFADKDRHQIFLEPETSSAMEWYVQGMSSSLPKNVQQDMYHSVEGLENVKIIRHAYAIEYDCIDPTDLFPSLESKQIKGLYLAGQVNGTSGYEEAGAQGLLCGINASLYLKGEKPFIPTRDMSYIGVMCDDLTSKGTDEPYRMMTSRAEHRLHLRQDNADIRLTKIAERVGLASEERLERLHIKTSQTEELIDIIKSSGKDAMLRRPEVSIYDVIENPKDYKRYSLEQAQIQIKYEGYLKKERAHVRSTAAMENRSLPSDTPYLSMDSLRIEARQKLNKIKPVSLGQASRIPGVSPADIAVLSVWLRKNEEEAIQAKEQTP
ncbi:MAG: tRNA uridine-5-carboxymethylaminomethyl(34) synthesis enzyme MnmG [Christensenellaceae bacterium]|nr:tRNA uridine-5-carboxymethylaminomethyl(34) synthesis enzyme MnmG [Christensenellaceae bacterium]